MANPRPYRLRRLGSLALAAIAAGSSYAQSPNQRDLSKGNTLYVVPYAHLDTQWRWAYPQTIREYLANTLTRNFTLIKKYPHYVFNFSGSRRYEMMKEYYPSDYERLRGYVKAGRWFPCGSSVDEGDANVPSAESLIRHVLYGNRYFDREFGVHSHEFMLPDCFGFPYALPSVLAYCGVKGFSTQKLTWGSSAPGVNGIPFKVGRWIGPDGKSVVAALDPGAYSGPVNEDLSENTSWLARIQNTGKLSGAFVDYHYYGTGDTGGAPRADSVDWIEKSIAGTGPITVVSARADAMFDSLKPDQIAKLPTYQGELELTNHSAGSISSEAYMKRWNRKSEQLADGAERASVAAMLLGTAPYPSARLYNAWDLVLGSQMHDMLPGTSIPKAYELCWNDFSLAQNQFAAVETDAIGAIAGNLNTRGDGAPLAIYNPLSIARTDVVEATVPDIAHGRFLTVVGPDGRTVPAQRLQTQAGSVKIAFAATVKPTSVSIFHVVAGGRDARSDLRVDNRHLENSQFKVTVNGAGDIASIYDKANHREALKSPTRLEMLYENPRQYPAWNMDWEDASKPPRETVGGPAKITIAENGPTRVALRIERTCNGSKFVQTVSLNSGARKVDVANDIDWRTKERALKAAFPMAAGSPTATYDIQLGTITRGNANPKKFEVPQHQWFDVSKPDGSYGVGVLNDCKFASDKPDDNTIRLTMIYTPGTQGGTEDQGTQDIGRHHILFSIAPHAGDWRKGEVPWQAQRLNQPLRAFSVGQHGGGLGRSFQLLQTSDRQVAVQAIKKAEDSSEIVVRLRELTGHPNSHEVIRFAQAVKSAREVDGQEHTIGAATVINGALIATVPGYSLKSYAVTLAPVHGSPSTVSSPVQLKYNADVVSTSAHPGDGQFANGHALSAEQLPKTLTVDGIKFATGPTADGQKNAVVARGQSIALPRGYSRLYVLAAADSDTPATFRIGSKVVRRTVQRWDGYIGQWDNRHWSADPGPNFSNYGTMNGLTPGYVKTNEVAWFASHSHTPDGNTFYEYSYLYKYGFDIPAGAASLTLPNNPAIKVLAVSVAKGAHDTAVAAAPLVDTLVDHVGGGSPSISPAAGHYSDSTTVRLDPPLYYRVGGLHYTLDGSTPTAKSPVYEAPFTISDPTTIKVAQVDGSGRVGAVAETHLDVQDITPPSVVSASIVKSMGVAKVVFSEPVTKPSAQAVSNYTLSSGAKVVSASLAPDRRTVELTFDPAPDSKDAVKLAVSGVCDLAKKPNIAATAVTLVDRGAVFTSPALEPKVSRAFSRLPDMPIHKGDSWTLNLFVRMDHQPDNRTMIAGFGRSFDGRQGTGRYFTKFPSGINFWIADRDVQTHVPLDLGKWQMLTATYDGTTVRLYKNGEEIGSRSVAVEDDTPQVRVLPIDAWDRKRRLDGAVRDLTVWDLDLPAAAIKRLWEANRDK